MIVRLTASCNNRCAFCLVDDEIAARDFRPFVAIAAEIDKCAPDEPIDIFGGEPTIDPNFWQVLEYALAGGRSVSLATNCRLFAHRPSAERLALVGYGRLSVRTSVLGHDAMLHDRLNGVHGGAFHQTLAGIANLTELGFGVQTNIVIMAENIEHLLGCVMAAVGAGSRTIKLSGLVRTARVLASIPHPAQVRDRLATLVPLLHEIGLSVRLEKLTPCVVPEYLDILHRESDPSPESASWFVKTARCQSCALAGACDGAERGAVARYGDGWLMPFTELRDNRVPAGELDEFMPDEKAGSVIRVELPSDLEAVLALIPAIAAFRARHPHLFLLA
jgi:MoaA/NifB/PqqE/SkfB family radical SAM enzyme